MEISLLLTIDRSDITATRMESPLSDSFYSDPEMKKMDIRLANLAYYHGLEQKLIDDIKQVILVISGSQNSKFKILFL